MNIVICGTRGEGKSTLSLYLARQFSDTVVILDPRGTYSAVGIECFDLDDLFDALEDKTYLQSGKKPLPLVLRIDGPTPELFGQAAARLFPAYFRFRGKISLVIDEARELQSPHWIDPHLNRLVRQSPLDRVCIVQNTHQLMDWNSATKSVTSDFYLFRQLGPRNYTVVTDHFGGEIADIAAKLPKHHLVHCWFDRRDDDKSFEVWDDPSKWFEQITEPYSENEPEGNTDATIGLSV